MNPSRIREDGPPQLQRIIASARADEPSPEELAALAATLPLAKVPVGAAKLAVTGAGVKVLVAVTVVALGGGVGLWLMHRSEPPAVVASPAAPPPAPTPTPAPPEPTPAPEPARAPAPAPAPETKPAHPSDETALLDRALEAEQRGDPNAVLAAVAQHEREFPHGALSEEREVLAIKALLTLNRSTEAQARLTAFEQRFPTSTAREKLERLLDPLP